MEAPTTLRKLDQSRAGSRPSVVICGSFRRDRAKLADDFRALTEAQCRILSPATVDFVEEVDGFVLAEHELDERPETVEQRHLDALQAADFIWLHAPEGYVGPSGSLEVGVAHALGIPVLARVAPADVTLRHFVEVVSGPLAAAARASALGAHTPARPLHVLQGYYGRMAATRGFSSESAQDTMLLLTEEVGELARAIRKSVGLARAGADDGDTAGELADVQLYLLHLANVIGVDLAAAVASKEQLNHVRYAREAA